MYFYSSRNGFFPRERGSVFFRNPYRTVCLQVTFSCGQNGRPFLNSPVNRKGSGVLSVQVEKYLLLFAVFRTAQKCVAPFASLHAMQKSPRPRMPKEFHSIFLVAIYLLSTMSKHSKRQPPTRSQRWCACCVCSALIQITKIPV